MSATAEPSSQRADPPRLRERARDLIGLIGVPPRLLEQKVDAALEVLARYGVSPTVAVAVPPFARQRHVLRFLQRRGAEMALLVREPRLIDGDAVAALRGRGIACRGVRAQELHSDISTGESAGKLGLEYASTGAYLWPVMEEGMLSTLGPGHHSSPFTSPVLPRFRGGALELPVSLPGDELSAEQRAEGSSILERRFASILERVRDRGELFVLRLTQQNLALAVPALERLLAIARHGTPPLWIAPLGEIARWWQRKAHASVLLEKTERGYRVHLESPPEARLLVNPAAVKGRSDAPAPLADGWIPCEGDRVEVAATRPPIVGIGPRTGTQFKAFLEGEGFPFESSGDPQSHAIHFDDPDPFAPSLEFKALARIQCLTTPIVRLARWPHGFSAAMAVTIELDSIKLADFLRQA